MAADISLILKYFPAISQKQQDQFGQLQSLYESWNSQINVISRKDIEKLYEHHVLHSLGIAKVISFQPKTKILDVGTGGGFPGIPLAILFPDCHFHLVDSIGKKIKVVKAISENLGLENVFAEQSRAEDVDDKFDFVVSRAVAPIPDLLEWAKGKVLKTNFNKLPNGMLLLKGGDLTEELRPVKQQVKIFELSDAFAEDYFETKKIVFIKIN